MKKIITIFLALAVTFSCMGVKPVTALADQNTNSSKMNFKAKGLGTKTRLYHSGSVAMVTKGFGFHLTMEDPEGKTEQKVKGRWTYWEEEEDAFIKGIDDDEVERISIKEDYSGSVKWSSSKPSVASVDQKGNVKAKKCGKTVIKAKYNNQESIITVKVVKNKFTADPEDTSIDHPSGIGDSTVGQEGIISISFDKKGNLIYKHYTRTRRTPRGKNHIKANEKYILHKFSSSKAERKYGCVITVRQRGHVVAKTRQKIMSRADTNNKVRIDTYKISKNKIKMKRSKIDLRNCTISIDNDYKYICKYAD